MNPIVFNEAVYRFGRKMTLEMVEKYSKGRNK